MNTSKVKIFLVEAAKVAFHFLVVMFFFMLMIVSITFAIIQFYLKDIAKEPGHGWYAFGGFIGFFVFYVLWMINIDRD